MADRAVLERFCEDTYPSLVGALSLTVRDRFLAEELAQEALLRACQRWAYVSDLSRLPAGVTAWGSTLGATSSADGALSTGHMHGCAAPRPVPEPTSPSG